MGRTLDIDSLVAVSRLTDALSRATTLDDVYTAALDALQQTLRVERASVLLFDEHDVCGFVAWRGLSTQYRTRVNGHTPWRPDTPNPEPICVADVANDPSLAALLPVFEAEGIRALAFFPLTYRDRVLGKFMVYYAEPHEFSPFEIELARTVAGQIAFGVARLRTEQRLTLDIAARKAAERRRFFLTKASGLLASSLDYEKTLAHLAHLIVADLGDWCTIDIVGDDGELRRLQVLHRDPDKQPAAARMAERGIANGAEVRLRPIVDGGETLLVQAVDADLVDRFNLEPSARAVLDELGFESYMTVPLVAGGDMLGALTIVSADPARRYDEEDLAVAAELGRRAGYAISNARLYRRAQEANRAKDEFLATLSHELRTPMTATLGWASLLRMRDVSHENFELAVETIERSTRAQAKLIDEILDVSRIVTGKLQLNVAPVNLQAVIEAAVDAVRPSIAAKGIALQLDLGRVEGVPTGDAERLQQVIWNLLSNSVKFTPAGGSIAVTLEQPDRHSVRVSVRDTGAGIPRKFLPVVFERFRQADSSSTREHGGLGLGLAIVKSIVELHGGAVTAASDGEGRGATFSIALPVTKAAAVAAAPAEAEAPLLSLAGVSVLLVEDEDDTRRMLATALRSFGASVVAVDSAPAALDALRAAPPHVVVSDIAMPGEDGYSLIVKIRAGEVEQSRDVPAVALTAYARQEDRDRILASGFGFHLTKPVDPLAMARTVWTAAGR